MYEHVGAAHRAAFPSVIGTAVFVLGLCLSRHLRQHELGEVAAQDGLGPSAPRGSAWPLRAHPRRALLGPGGPVRPDRARSRGAAPARSQ
ncbi:MAG: hypothetical protein ACLTDR_15015 [Adlercreutzia equolifaciens]